MITSKKFWAWAVVGVLVTAFNICVAHFCLWCLLVLPVAILLTAVLLWVIDAISK